MHGIGHFSQKVGSLPTSIPVSEEPKLTMDQKIAGVEQQSQKPPPKHLPLDSSLKSRFLTVPGGFEKKKRPREEGDGYPFIVVNSGKKGIPVILITPPQK